MHILLDMDGVLADFVSASLVAYGISPEVKVESWNYPQELLGMSLEDFFDGLNENGPEFWKKIPRYPWTTELIRTIEGFGSYTISTKPAFSEKDSEVYSDCCLGKIQWLQDNISGDYSNLMLGKQST